MDIKINQSDGRCEVLLQGRFTFSDYKNFRKAVGSAFSGEISRVVFNLSGLDFINSSGLGMMLLARDEANRMSKDILLRKPQGQVRRILDAARFESFFMIEN